MHLMMMFAMIKSDGNDTSNMLVDCMTKAMSSHELLTSLSSGHFSLVPSDVSKLRKAKKSEQRSAKRSESLNR